LLAMPSPLSLYLPSIPDSLSLHQNNNENSHTDMNISDLWPLLTIIVPIIVLYFGYIQQLRIRVAVLEQANEDMQKTLINMQKRMDNHSKKQDDILEAIASLKVELVRQMAATEKQVNSIKTEQVAIAADLKNITRTLSNINRN